MMIIIEKNNNNDDSSTMDGHLAFLLTEYQGHPGNQRYKTTYFVQESHACREL